MDFEVKYYQEISSQCPVEEFLIALRRVNNSLAGQAFKGIEKLRNRAYHKEPLSKHLESGLWELRIQAGSNTLRIIYTFAKGKIIILLHVFIKKQQKMPKKELEIARSRLRKAKGGN